MWLEGFEQVTFPQSPGFPYRWPSIRGVCWHTTQGWQAEHAFNVYRDAPKGACPHVTVEYRYGTGRELSKRRFQHVDTSQASYAVQRGSVDFPCRTETNASGIVQIERVGFAADDVTTDELRWLGEQVLAPILAAHPDIPRSVYKGPRMNDDEWAAWGGGQCGHRDVCCQPERHSDPGELDLDAILEYALRANDPQKRNPMPDYIVRDGHDANRPWIAVYPEGGLRHIGGTEAGHLLAQTPPLVLVDELDTPAYERTARQAGAL